MTCALTMEYEKACCVHCYHVHREVWEAAEGEVLACEREQQERKDKYAVAVKKDGLAQSG